MKNFIAFCIVLLSFVELNSACHFVHHLRRKRQTYGFRFRATTPPAEDTKTLREYFTNCMKSEVGDIWDWPSVIDTTILDTSWFESNEQSICSTSKFSDTPECWMQRLNALLERNSFLLKPARQCIARYSVDTRRGVVRDSEIIFANSGPPARAPRLCSRPRDQPFFPNSPTVREYSSCSRSRVQFPSERSQLDFPSVIQFVEGHTICSSEFPGCDVNNQVAATRGNPGAPRWPYRFAAIIKNASPLRTAITTCNEMVFPLVTDWASWSACSASCGGGTRSRTRLCFRSGCNAFETQTCGEETCPGCAMSMFSRRRCGPVSISKESCLQMGCCYQRRFCYRSLTTRAPPTVSNPCRSPNNFRTLSLSFRPTSGTLRSFGGEPGFPGSSAKFQCDESRSNRRCGGRIMNCYSCSRAGCCWSATRGTCYHPTIKDVTIRTECAPGFENPPACTDINDCTPTSCMNGGKCIDRIQGFECRCLPPYIGPRCKVDPTAPQGCGLPVLSTPDGNGRITTFQTIFPTGSSLTYKCDPGFAAIGPVVTTCQQRLPNAFTWSLDSSPPSCKRECRLSNAPPVLPGVTVDLPTTGSPFMVGDSITYMCLNQSELIDPNTVTCQRNGMWFPSSVGTCTKRTCSLASAPIVVNTTRTPSTNGLLEPGSFLTYQCVNVLESLTPDTTECQQDGTWEPSVLGECFQIVCGLPILDTPDFNGRITTGATSFSIGTMLTYLCDFGFSASGPTVTECQMTPPDIFVWSLDTSRPFCLEEDDCLRSNCSDNAFCTNTFSGFTCICDAGFSGDGFTCNDINECELEADNCHSNAMCTNVFGSFLCICDDGFTGNGVSCEDIDECELGTDNCHSNAKCTNTVGSFVCICDDGFSGNGVLCQDINECTLGTHNCNTIDECMNTIGSFSCGCNPGFSGNGVICTDIDECDLETDNCHSNAMCTNVMGSFFCTCDVGFSGDGVLCQDIDECTLDTHNCNTSSQCMNTIGSFSCGCNPGFSGNGVICTDIDECDLETDNCHSNAMCTNVMGSFFCTCDVGFSGDGVLCQDIDECTLGTHNCNTSSECMNTIGSFSCGCNPGFSGNGVICTDIDECDLETDNCHSNAMCTNVMGSFFCTCDVGFSGDGVLCQDIDECTLDTHNCNTIDECMNTIGSFSCGCNPGFSGNGVICTDIDECDLETDNCHSNAMCTNVMGSFFCTCDVGFSGDGVLCQDIDECTLGTHNCNTIAECMNTIGSFSCGCDPGFSGNGVICTDIDECSLGTDNCNSNAMCINTNGSFMCDCNPGYSGDGIMCPDIDECLVGTDNCGTNAECVNTIGSFMCDCSIGFSGDGIICTDIDECLLFPAGCDTNAFCFNTVGSFVCECDIGFTGNGLVCTDVDECALEIDSCDIKAECINEMGDFSCRCLAGYTGDGFLCDAVNACDFCNESADCLETDGGFECVCQAGFVGDGISCTESSITCAPPPTNPNVGHEPELSVPYPVNTEVFYFCFTGAQEGPFLNTCTETGSWSNGSPSCIIEIPA